MKNMDENRTVQKPKKTKQQTTNLQSCLKLADIAVPQAPAAANYKQIWCWVTEIPWPHGGIIRKVSDSPLFSVFHPEGTNTPSYGPRFLYELHGETDRSAVGWTNLPSDETSKVCPWVSTSGMHPSARICPLTARACRHIQLSWI